VIANHPRLDDGSPFPTTYWLVCPVLAKRVSKLESEGRMAKLNEDLVEQRSLRERLADAIHGYRADRDAMGSLEDSGNPPGGGPDRVKCLHAHAAHDLVSSSNPVGALTLGEAGWPDCREPCFEVRSS
jgi:hypothetical protein